MNADTEKREEGGLRISAVLDRAWRRQWWRAASTEGDVVFCSYLTPSLPHSLTPFFTYAVSIAAARSSPSF